MGIVAEVVGPQENGLIVPGEQAAFEKALDWCAQHLDEVRQKGQENSSQIRSLRSWGVVADRFRSVFDETIAFAHVPHSGFDLVARRERDEVEGAPRQPDDDKRTPAIPGGLAAELREAKLAASREVSPHRGK